jgi:hypothetical protein
MLRIETGLLVIALLIVLTYPALGLGWLEGVELRFSALAHRRSPSALLVGVLLPAPLRCRSRRTYR